MTSKSIPKAFLYCPKCNVRALKPSSSKSIVCTECGFEYFFNPAAAVAGIICNHNGELLVTVRAHDPCKGQWDLPRGFVDPGETAEQGLAREIKEELNLDVVSMDYMMSTPNEYVYKDVTYLTLDMAFVCHVSEFSDLKAMDDVEQVLFVSPEEVDTARFAFGSMRVFVERLKG